MKIFLINRDCIGGVKQYNLELTKALKEINYDVVTVNYQLNDRKLLPEIKYTNSDIDCIINEENLFLISKSKCIDFHEDDTLIFSEEIEYNLMYLLGFKGRLIYTLHGNTPHYYRTLNEMSRVLSGIITVNQKQIENIPNEILHIPLICSPQINSIKQLEESCTKSYELIFVGRINYAKGIDLFLELCSQIQGEKLIIASDQEIEEEYWTLINNAPNLKIIFNLENHQVLKEISKSKFLIHPSRSEGFGIVLIEGIKNYSIPIVLEGSGGPEEILDEFNYLILKESEFIPKAIDIYNKFTISNSSLLIKALQESINKKYSNHYLTKNFDLFIQNIINSEIKIFISNYKRKKYFLNFKNLLKILWRKLV